MFSECANPSCRAQFDYPHGQLFRFHKEPPGDGQPANTHSVQHFWLCGSCAGLYRLDYVQDVGILLKPRYDNGASPQRARFIAPA